MICSCCGRELPDNAQSCSYCSEMIENQVYVTNTENDSVKDEDNSTVEAWKWKQPCLQQLMSYWNSIRTAAAERIGRNTAECSLKDCILSISDCLPWSSVPSLSVSNISSYFPDQPDYGERIAFLDTALFMKKGKCGVLFYENGLSVKPTASSALSIDYETVCSGIVDKTNEYLLADYKFNLKKSHYIDLIAGASRIAKILQDIQRVLLSGSAKYQFVYSNAMCSYTDKLAEFLRYEDSDASISIATGICDFAELGNDEIKTCAYAIKALVSAYFTQFDEAISYAEINNLGDIKAFISDLKTDFQKEKSQIAYQDALKKYESGDYAGAIESAEQAIDDYVTEDYWKLWFESVYASASEKNCYNKQLLERFVADDWKHSDIKIKVFIDETERYGELQKKCEAHIEAMSVLIPEKISNEDTLFFESNPDLINLADKYGMTPIMYAVLFRKDDLYTFLKDHNADGSFTNILDQDLVDIAVSILDEDACLEKVKDYDVWYREEYSAFYKAYKNAVAVQTIAEIADVFTSGEASVTVAAARCEFNHSDYSALDSPGTLEHRFDRSVRDHIEELKHVNADRLIDFFKESSLQDQSEASVLVPDISSLDQNAEFAEFVKNQRTEFVEDYLSKNCPPKGEFEKTVQYQERRENSKSDAEKIFDADIKKIQLRFLAEKEKANEAAVTAANHAAQSLEFAKKFITHYPHDSVSLLSYNADREQFLLRVGQHVSDDNKLLLTINIPIDQAAAFKNTFKEKDIEYEVFSGEYAYEDICILHCMIRFQDAAYPFTCLKSISGVPCISDCIHKMYQCKENPDMCREQLDRALRYGYYRKNILELAETCGEQDIVDWLTTV